MGDRTFSYGTSKLIIMLTIVFIVVMAALSTMNRDWQFRAGVIMPLRKPEFAEQLHENAVQCAWPKPSLESENDNHSQVRRLSQPKLVLLWTSFFGESLEVIFNGNNLTKCDCVRLCTFTTDKALLPNASAVIFHARDVNFLALPSYRTKDQLWILMNFESPINGRITDRYDDMFNRTMTYRNDSDFKVTYGHYVSRPVQTPLPEIMTKDFNKRKPAFWLVSNCNRDRASYVKELAKLIDVDIFGTCGRSMPCTQDSHDCLLKMSSSYVFYLAFENSKCEQYITEKLWRTLKYPGGSIPVVVGAPQSDYTAVAPPDSFIHVSNFSGIHDLVDFLKKVMASEESFKYYHQWRKRYVVYEFGDDASERASCSVCGALQTGASGGSRSTAGRRVSTWFNDGCKPW